MDDLELEPLIAKLEAQLARAVGGQAFLPLTPSWWQQFLLDWATADEEFRVQMLRFVDVLPTLRSDLDISDHVGQYFRDAAPGTVKLASRLVTQPLFMPLLTRAVGRSVHAMADRFIAGSSPDEALPRIQRLASQGIACTLDLLGEATLSEAEADAYLARYCDLIETLASNRRSITPIGSRWEGVAPINLSVKLSALSPHFEPAAPEYVSAQLRTRLRQLLRAAQRHGAFINVDMEQFRYKDLIHRTFADLLAEDEFATFTDIGIVVQAYLRDAGEDLERLRLMATKRDAPLGIRLVKGAYWDEERILAGQNSWPVPVFEEKVEADAAFERCTDLLLACWPYLRPAFGTHNPRSIAQAVIKARRRGIPDAEIEFQTLHGLASGLSAAVSDLGYRMRVYTPVGAIIPGMAYLVRRLLENTSSQAWFRQDVRRRVSPVTASPSLDRPAQAGKPAAVAEPFRNAAPAQFFEAQERQRMVSALDEARAAFGATYPLLVGGRRVQNRVLSEIRYPAEPDQLLGLVAQATLDDVDHAVATATTAFPSWRDRPVTERAGLLRRAAELIEQRRYALAATMVFESAKPWHEADGDVAEAVDYLRYYADQAEQLMQPLHLLQPPGEENEYSREARGVAAIIAPWNFPLAILTGMTVAALATGNTALVKPAGPSPIIAAQLVELLHQAGIPPEVVQYLPGSGGQIGQALVDHPAVNVIAFTGSNAVGLSILARAAQVHGGQHTIKRVIAELGGKNAVIIDDDADLDLAIADTITSAFGYAGQKCSACSRLIVVGSAYRETIERLRGAVASLIVGPPHDPATFVPPVISSSARERILSYVESGTSSAKLLVQGKTPSGQGYYVPPTVFVDVPQASPLAREEIFGPVLSVFHARDFDEALRIAADSDFALTGGLFSRNPRHLDQARHRFRVGNLYINRRITGAVIGRQAFGGLNMSGEGEKAGGPDYLRQFTVARMITENTMRRGFAPQ